MGKTSRLFCFFCCSVIGCNQAWANDSQKLWNEKLDCIISPSVVTDLGSSLPGVLRSIKVDRSDVVKVGDVIAVLDSDVERVALQLAKVRATLNSEIRLQETNAEYGDRRTERYKTLFDRHALAEWDLDQSKTETKLAEIRLVQALDAKRLAQLERDKAQQILDRRTVRSPISGVVVERFKDVGEYVDEQSIARIAQLSPLHVDVIVPVARLKDLKPGMLANVWSEQLEGRWVATVDRIDRVADPASGTIGVRLLLDNADYAIPAGIRCKMEFNQQVVPDVALNAPLKEKPIQNPPKQCNVIGPFKELGVAKQEANDIASPQIQVSLETREQDSYRVLSNHLSTRKDANAYIEQLKESNITDYFLLNGNDGGFVVSLGQFSKRESAQRYKEKLNDMGLSTSAIPSQQQISNYWLLLKGQESDLEAAIDRLTVSGKNKLQSEDC